jgi:DNA polymerase alpha subunit B
VPCYLLQHTSPAPNKRRVVLSADHSPAMSSPGVGMGSPESQGQYSQISGMAGTGGAKYVNREDAGKVMTSFNKFLAERGDFAPSTLRPLGKRVRLVADIPEDFDNVDRYRYMHCTLGERAGALDKHIMNVQADMMRWKAIGELQPVRVPSQQPVWTCGRVCCDAAEGKINKSSVMIEGSRVDSSGRTALLDLRELDHFSLFPGQVILVNGTDAAGGNMVVKAIVEGVPKPLPMTSPSRLLEYHHSPQYQGGKPVSMFCAAGPFTPGDDLGYQPLKDLLLKVIEEKPDVLLLLGPFVDLTQPLLATGETWLADEETGEKSLASYELIFMQRIIRDCLHAYFNAEGAGNVLPTQIILVPSLSDGHHEFVYPQPPFGNKGTVKSAMFAEELGNLKFPFQDDADNLKRVNLLPNPCMLRVNEALVGATSTDVLFALSGDVCNSNIGNDRMARLAGHLLEQQSFYPMFPAPEKIHPQLDLRHSKHWQMKRSPDILFVPSKLSTMVTEIHGSLVVNPGLLVKGSGGGTFARLTIHPLPEAELRGAASDAPVAHALFSRTRVDIMKI